MNSLYKKYFKGLYLKTGGFIPTKPIQQRLYPGDFFQIRNGEMIVLGNIYKNSIISPESSSIEYGIKLYAANWEFSDGVTKLYSSSGTGNNAIEGEFKYSKQMLAFDSPGSYLFKANNSESVRIDSWHRLADKLIIKLTQAIYSFREVYIVTECAIHSDWTLAIAGSKKAELEIATNSENYGLGDIFGHSSSKPIQSKDIEYYHHETNRTPTFIKAKKLVVKDEIQAIIVKTLIKERQSYIEWARSFYDFDNYPQHVSINTNVSVLDMLPAHEFNPVKALKYFQWKDVNLDDIEKLFTAYGN